MVPCCHCFKQALFGHTYNLHTKEIMIKRRILFLFATLLVCVHATLGLPVEIAPGHSAIRYVGRFTEDHQFGWTGSRIEIEFEGTAATGILELTAGKAATLTVVVDGNPTFLKIKQDQKIYPLAEGLATGQRHRIVLFKRSEGALGTVRFGGLRLSEGAQLFKPASPHRKILVVGDSITCGYGNEAASLEEGNTLENENGYMSYAAIAARNLNADIMMVCWSGRGMIRNYGAQGDTLETLPELFNRILPTQKMPEWNHSRFVPDVVVINLGTNDMNTSGGKTPLEKEPYIAAYKTFLARIRAFAPNAKTILSIGPMAIEPVSDWLQELAENDSNTSVLVYEKLGGTEDLGGHWHPSVKKDVKMAAELVAEIQKTTDWK